jgi:hypothetical protein
VITTAAVLAATFLERWTGLPVIDGLMGLGVAGFILWSGWGILKDTLSPLLGESPDPALVRHIRDEALQYPGVLGVHDLMVHDYGPGRQFASLHVEFPAEADVIEAHDVIDNMEKDFLARDHILVTIHYDPIVTADAAVCELREYVKAEAKKLDPELHVHDLRLVPGPTHTNVVFDLALPAGFRGDCNGLLRQLKEAVEAQDPKYNCVIQLEQEYVSDN